jgi:hypothetical protein
MAERPYNYETVREAAENLGGTATLSAIEDYIKRLHPGVNDNALRAYIHSCTVNLPSRTSYWPNNKPRLANSPYDVLFSVGRGQFVLYDPSKHGGWEIRLENGRLIVAPAEAEILDLEDEVEAGFSFALESHLRDFLASNIATIPIDGHQLKLYADDAHQGVEYPTGVGPIDILAIDDTGALVIFELKLGRGADRACGQLLRYMGWVKAHLARDGRVRGVIVAAAVDDKLKYAASIVPDVSLFEYSLDFKVRQVSSILQEQR